MWGARTRENWILWKERWKLSIYVNLLGVSEMECTGMGHFKSDNHEVYYCGQDIQRRNGVAFIMYRRNAKMCYGIQPCKWQNSNNTPAMQANTHDCLTLQYLQREKKKLKSYMIRYNGVDEIPRGGVLYVGPNRRLECQRGTGQDKRHNRKIRTGGTGWTGKPTRRIL